jgi:hypothetical protein
MAADSRLTTIREQILDQLVDITENPKPEYWIDGQRVLWADHQKNLWAQLDAVDRKIQEGDSGEIITAAFT